MLMRRLWLTFSQAVTVAVAVVFVLATFKPDWLPSGGSSAMSGMPLPGLPGAAPQTAPGTASATVKLSSTATDLLGGAVDGTFDDCQDLVKAMFADAPFRQELGLSAVNSINWARVAAQIPYYVAAALAMGTSTVLALVWDKAFAALPGASSKLEGGLEGPTAVGTVQGRLVLGADRFFDGRSFDPDRIDEYLGSAA